MYTGNWTFHDKQIWQIWQIQNVVIRIYHSLHLVGKGYLRRLTCARMCVNILQDLLDLSDLA